MSDVLAEKKKLTAAIKANILVSDYQNFEPTLGEDLVRSYIQIMNGRTRHDGVLPEKELIDPDPAVADKNPKRAAPPTPVSF